MARLAAFKAKSYPAAALQAFACVMLPGPPLFALAVYLTVHDNLIIYFLGTAIISGLMGLFCRDRLRRDFRLLAAAGLAIQFGAQALISMAVNTGLAPSKGMTMPFISYGGSSMIALSVGMGLLLAFTRRNPFVSRSPYVVKWSGE